MQEIIKTSNLSFGYGAKNLFSELNFHLKSGQILAILGLNGVGKSTLLYILMGVLKGYKGSFNVEQSYSFVSQNFNLSFDYSVLDVMLMGRVKNISIFGSPSSKDIEICTQKLEKLGILHLKHQSFDSLSGGQKQLVLIARALAMQSEILFLDEPTSALDLKNQGKVLKLIKELNESLNLSVVFTTHDPNHARAVCNTALILNENPKFGSSNEILTTQNLQELYGIQIELMDAPLGDKTISRFIPIFDL